MPPWDGQQLGGRTVLNDPPLPEYQDPIHGPQGRQAVGDNERGPTMAQAIKVVLQP